MLGKIFKKKEWLLIVGLLAICAAAALLLWPRNQGNIAIVTYKGRTIAEIKLNQEGVYSIDADLPVTLEVKNNRVRFIHSVCPNHICEGYGWIGLEGEFAICLPAGVTVQIVKH